MNKLLIACMSAAFALSVNAAPWFNGGLSSAGATGGTWTGATGEEAISLTPESGEVSFAATATKSLDTDVVTITSEVALTEYDSVEDLVAGDAKAALAPVDGKYYGLVSGTFVELSGAEPTDDPVTVTIQMRKVLGRTQVKYSVDGTALADKDGNTWIYTTITEAPTEVAYSGTGTVSSLAGATDTPEYLTAANPTISDAAGLAAVAKTAADFNGLAGQTVTLGADIALTGTVTPIGAGNNKDNRSAATFGDTAFKGVFDGDNHTISGVILPCQDYVGLFGSTLGATIKNLKVSLGNATGFDGVTTGDGRTEEYSGAPIVGCALNTTIENCETVATEGAVFTAAKAAAGIVGYAGSGTTVKDCTNNLPIKSTTNAKAAGIVGCAQDATGDHLNGGVGLTIDGCSNTGTVTGKSGGNGSGLVTYTDNAVTFKGANSTIAGDVVSVIYLNSGSITLEEGATFTVPADKKTVNKNAVDGLQLATVSEGVATLVKAADVTVGGSYKVMAAGATITLANVGDSITLDETLATATVTTTADDAEVQQSGNVYTVVSTLATPGFTITVAENVTTTITINGDEVALADVPATLTEKDTYTVTFAPATGYMFAADADTEYTGTVGTTDISITAPTALAIVATVDGTTYASMDEAIAAAIAAGKPLTPAEGQVVVAPAGFDAQVDPETGAVTFVAKVAEAVADGYVYTGFLPTDAARAVKIFDGSLETLKTMKLASQLNGGYINSGKATTADATIFASDNTIQSQWLDGNVLKVCRVNLVEKDGAVYAYAPAYAWWSNQTAANLGTEVAYSGTWVTPAKDAAANYGNVCALAVAPAPVAAVSCSFDGEVAVSTETVSFATINDSGKFAGCYDADNTAASTANRPWSSRSDKLFGQKALWSILTTAKLGSTTTDAPIWSMGENAGIALMQNGESVKLVSWKRGDAASTVVLAQGNVKGGKTAYNTFVVVTDETAEADKYKLYIDGDLVAASGEQETVDYAINCYQFGDTYGGSVFGKNTDAWLDEFETFTYPLSAAEVEVASVKFSDKVDNSVLVWNGDDNTVIDDATTAENPLGNPAPIGGATELVFNANATISIADDCTLKNFTVNDGTISLKKGSSSSALNDETFTLNGGKLYFTWGEKAANVSGTVILNGGTIEGTDNWPGLNGTLTLVTQKDTSLINSSGDAKTLGGGKIIKQGAADLTINTTCGAWSDDGFGQVELVIEEGKVLLRKNVNHTLAKVTGAGTLVLDGGSLTVTDPTDVATIVPTAAAIEAGKVIKTEELEGGAVKYTVADAVQFTKAETITVGDMNGYYKSGKTEADEGCYAVVGQLASAATEFSLTVGETVVTDTDTISVSIGNNVMMTTKYFTVAEDGTLSVANVILAVEDVKVTVGGTDYVLATTPSGTLTVDSVVSNGSVNKVTAESDGSFKIVAKTTHEYISINFVDQAGTTAYITKKTYNWPGYQPSSTYGITPPESDKGELALYPCGWVDPDAVADYWEGATLEYMAYAVGKGSALVTLKYTKKDVEPIDPTKPTEEYASPEAAQAAADAINADKATRIAKPFEAMTDERKAAYDAVVTATVVGNKIVVDFSEDAKDEIRQVANVAVADADILDTAATTATVDVVPGFYYAIVGGTDVNAITTAGEAVLATGDTVTLTKPDLGTTTKAFYKVQVSVTK